MSIFSKLFKDNEYILFLEYLEAMLKTGIASKLQILNVKKITYEEEGNKKWSRKVSNLIEDIENGFNIEDTLEENKIISKSEKDIMSLSSSEYEGLKAIKELRKDKTKTTKARFFVLYFPIILAAIAIPLQKVYEEGSNYILDLFKVVIQLTHSKFEIPGLLINNYLYIYQFLIVVLLVSIYISFEKYLFNFNEKKYLKIYKLKSNLILKKILNFILISHKLGIPGSKSLDLLLDRNLNKIEKNIIYDLKSHLIDGEFKSFKKILESYNLSPSASAFVGLGEEVQGSFYKFVYQAVNLLDFEIEKSLNKIRFLSGLLWKFYVLIFIGVPLGVFLYFINFKIMTVF